MQGCAYRAGQGELSFSPEEAGSSVDPVLSLPSSVMCPSIPVSSRSLHQCSKAVSWFVLTSHLSSTLRPSLIFPPDFKSALWSFSQPLRQPERKDLPILYGGAGPPRCQHLKSSFFLPRLTHSGISLQLNRVLHHSLPINSPTLWLF